MSYESIHTVITPSTTKQMINISNKDPCSYHKSAVNTSLTNLSIHWNHKHIRRSGTSDWTKTNRINIQIMVGISYLLLSDLLYTSFHGLVGEMNIYAHHDYFFVFVSFVLSYIHGQFSPGQSRPANNTDLIDK